MLRVRRARCRTSSLPGHAFKGTPCLGELKCRKRIASCSSSTLGGPSRKVVSREMVKKKWQLVTLDCAHRILLPSYQKSAKIGCGFCGGFEPMAQE
jgi:hypothetical protein